MASHGSSKDNLLMKRLKTTLLELYTWTIVIRIVEFIINIMRGVDVDKFEIAT